MSDCIIYILYYILSYIQHNGEVSLEYAPVLGFRSPGDKDYGIHHYCFICFLGSDIYRHRMSGCANSWRTLTRATSQVSIRPVNPFKLCH